MPDIPAESRSVYKVTRQFEAVVFDERAYRDGDEQYGEDIHTMRPGIDVLADPESWKGRKWKGRSIVSFTQGRIRYIARLETFLSATERQQVLGSEEENGN